MAIESERKFLVDYSKLPQKYLEAFQKNYRVSEAGYFTRPGEPAVRVTVGNHGRDKPKYKHCTKGFGTEHRPEYEFPISAEDALALLELAPTYLHKHRIDMDGWEIDLFSHIYGPFGGKLCIAEWEIHGANKPLEGPFPQWVKQEVTHLPRFTNQSLAWEFGQKSRFKLGEDSLNPITMTTKHLLEVLQRETGIYGKGI